MSCLRQLALRGPSLLRGCAMSSPQLQQLRLVSGLPDPKEYIRKLGPADRPQSAPRNDLMVVSPRPGLFAQAVEGLHRLLMFVVRVHSASARERYVRHFLSQHVDSFATEIILLKQPDTLELSVGKQLDMVVSWLRAQRCDREQLSEMLAAAPELLRQSVDSQLQPLADVIEAAAGPGVVQSALVAYPALAATPVRQLEAALRALQLSQDEARPALETLGDMLAHLAAALEEGSSASSSGGSRDGDGAAAAAATVAASHEEEQHVDRVRAAFRAALARQPGSAEHQAACAELEAAIDWLVLQQRSHDDGAAAAVG